MNNSNYRSSGRQRKYFQSKNHSILNETNRTNWNISNKSSNKSPLTPL
jgi:hypothetical protein